ncbi:hypothetical protein JX266_004774 [Neoarthrinium moseri]|nr:hypothetical protein JX266_004774 [Neoarthrinium moseri]
MDSIDSVFVDEEAFISEELKRDAIEQASDSELVLTWVSFLNFIETCHVTIVPSSDLAATGNRLGSGQTMIVDESIWKTTDSSHEESRVVAIKRPRTERLPDSDSLQARPADERSVLANFTLEIRALRHGTLRSHPNIVRLLGVTWAELGLPALVVERASESCPTLTQLLEGPGLLGVQKAEVLAGITEGLIAIHSVSLIHGDLKPDNILMFESTEGAHMIPKLADFAFSRTWKEVQSGGGTPYWNAPECCDDREITSGNPRSPLRDRFSLGLVFWNVLYCELPFTGVASADITRAKEHGTLLEKLANLRETHKYEAFMFEQELKPDFDDDDAILSIVEILEYLLHPTPERRAPRYAESIPSKLRTRRRVYAQSTITITENGSVIDMPEHFMDLKADMKADIEALQRQIEQTSLVETGIRYNVYRDLASGGRPIEHKAVLKNADASDIEKGEAHWFLAAQMVRRSPDESLQHCLEAGKYGNDHGRVNYLYRCIRDSRAVALDRTTHIKWLLQSLTSKQIFSDLECYTSTGTFERQLRSSFSEISSAFTTKYDLEILHDAFVHDVLGSTHSPHDQILINDKWATIVTAKETTYEKFREGTGSLRGDPLAEDALHEAALYGTGDLIRDLVLRHKIDIEKEADTLVVYGTALQAAFLRHNMQTVSALVDLGANVLPLFSEENLEAFLIEGHRETLHWLNHLIPLMRNENNRDRAQKTFNSILLTSKALQRVVIQRNWSLFVGILEIAQGHSGATLDEGIHDTLLIAAGLRRLEFVVALLVYNGKPHRNQLQLYQPALVSTCRKLFGIQAKDRVYERHYLGLKRDSIKRVPRPGDIHYQLQIAKILLQQGVSVEAVSPEQPGLTPLFWAVYHNRLLLVRLLIEDYGANPLVCDPTEGGTLLYISAFANSYGICKYLLSLPDDTRKTLVETPNKLGETALHEAATKSNPSIIKLLLAHGAQPLSTQFFGQNVLHRAALPANKRGFETLVDHIQKSSPDKLRQLLQQKDLVGDTPLHLLLGSNHQDGSTNKPVSSQDENMQRLLYKLLPHYTASPSRILSSLSKSHRPFIPVLNDPDLHGLTPLHHLLVFGADFPETLKVLLRRGANSWKQTTFGIMPIQIPARNGAIMMSLAMMEHLVTGGRGFTALGGGLGNRGGSVAAETARHKTSKTSWRTSILIIDLASEDLYI